MLDDAMKGIGAGLGKSAMTPPVHTPAANLTPPGALSAMKISLDGDRIIVSASVDLADAKRLVKRLQANIALLEAEGKDDEAAN
jgi:hypothetical protein